VIQKRYVPLGTTAFGTALCIGSRKFYKSFLVHLRYNRAILSIL